MLRYHYFWYNKLMVKTNWIFVLILVVAVIARLFGLDLGSLSPEQKASAVLSVSVGVLSVIGLYFLVKELFDRRLAMISSFLLAVSSWHIIMSRTGAKEIFASFVLIFAFYFIWHGLKYGHVFDFFLAGLFGGAGFFADKSYFVAPFVVLILFWNYWDYVKKDFSLSKYQQTKTNILGGFSLLVITTIAVVLPVCFYVWQNPAFILSPGSIFSTAEPLAQLLRNVGWAADKLLLVNFSGGNLVSWPIILLFVIGFIKEFAHWLKRKHGHFSVVHTLIFSWLFVMPIPILLSADLPSAAGLSVILPPVLILSAKGIWWVIEKLNRWSHMAYPRPHKHWVDLDAGPFLAMLALLLSIAILEISKLT